MKKIEWYPKLHGIVVRSNFFSATAMLAHIERLEGVTVVAKKSCWLTDDYEAYFDYRGCRFIVETPFVEVEVCEVDRQTPKAISGEVLEHAANYRWVNPILFFWSTLRYFMLPLNPP
ncbi:hypothetical protein [Halioxenophilus sp. WMMB6]|uniref:hypothetical protein n=1 Tax=Halioxenophilus sp. WMMB6 TaxID=3073815 RepID=UPI00295E2E92|nr:hypothetical protein [Halioxenophilus sp. WMMB6]